MAQNVFKAIGIFLLVYMVWVFTGGPERGDQRRAQLDEGESAIFIDATIKPKEVTVD